MPYVKGTTSQGWARGQDGITHPQIAADGSDDPLIHRTFGKLTQIYLAIKDISEAEYMANEYSAQCQAQFAARLSDEFNVKEAGTLAGNIFPLGKDLSANQLCELMQYVTMH